MPITEATMPKAEMDKIAQTHYCTQCEGSGVLTVAWGGQQFGCWILRCANLEHNQITKGYKKSKYEKEVETETRRFLMSQDSKITALAKFEGVTSLTTTDAQQIVNTLWPNAQAASPTEVYKAVAICAQYGLNPLMNHLFLIPFEKKENGKVVATTYSVVLGIGARRLIASRKHSYSYVDDTPRIMTPEEEQKIFGSVDANKLRFITKLRDTQTGATASGYGEWNRFKEWDGKKSDNQPKGTDKGNSMFNMAGVRSERAALDRLYPADMGTAANVPVVDERYEKPPESTGQIIEGDFTHIESSTGETATTQQASQTAQEGASDLPADDVLPNGLNYSDLKQTLTDLNFKGVGSYLEEHYKVTGTTLREAVAKLNTVQVEDFTKMLASRQGVKA